MIFSVCDIELMRLLWWCGNILPDSLNSSFDPTTVQNLISAGLVRRHKNSGSLALTEKGHVCLNDAGVVCPERSPLSYREDLIRRRLRVSEIALTGYRAGLDPFTRTIQGLSKESSLFLPSVSRGQKRNIWGSSRIAALLRLGNCCYGAYCVYPGVGRVNLVDEEKTLANCVSQSRAAQIAFLFTGDRYRSVLAELERREDISDGRLISYGEAWKRTTLPVHLLSCDDTGAAQLQIMAQPDYRRRLTRTALKAEYQPSPLPVWDALFRGMPFIMSADMDLRRLDAAVSAARQEGFQKIAVAALKDQAEAVLFPRYRDAGLARVFILTEEAVAEVTGGPPVPYTPPRTQFLTEKGETVDAPPIQVYRKAGGPR